LQTKPDIIEIFDNGDISKDIAKELEKKVLMVKSKKNRNETKITEADKSSSVIGA
jgi:cell division FtsZ-interacting protein ZapD